MSANASFATLAAAGFAASILLSAPGVRAQPGEQGLAPVPEPPPLPAPVRSGETLEPDVTIIQRERETVHEYRVNGRLYAVKVVPRNSDFPPYYLVDADGDGVLETRSKELTPDFLIPQWVLFRW